MSAHTDGPLRALPWLLGLYAAATLAHFAHNGVYLHDYPNLPPQWSPAEVYAAWGVLSLLGLCGYLLYRTRQRGLGLALLAVYALAGFGGLLHYGRAPPAQHSAAMNLTICSEALAAALLLGDLTLIAVHKLKPA